MVDGFHWTRVTSKQLRFLYEPVTLNPVPEQMYALAAKVDRKLAPAGDASISSTGILSGDHAAAAEQDALISPRPRE